MIILWPGQAQTVKVPTGWWYGCQPYVPATFTVLVLLLEAELNSEGTVLDFMSPTPAWIEPATFRIVAQHLYRCASASPVTLFSY